VQQSTTLIGFGITLESFWLLKARFFITIYCFMLLTLSMICFTVISFDCSPTFSFSAEKMAVGGGQCSGLRLNLCLKCSFLSC